MLNRIEGRHGLARVVFHGRRGELRQHYREGQEDQLSALGLVLNAIVLWNTRYMDAALQAALPGGAERPVAAEDHDGVELAAASTAENLIDDLAVLS